MICKYNLTLTHLNYANVFQFGRLDAAAPQPPPIIFLRPPFFPPIWPILNEYSK